MLPCLVLAAGLGTRLDPLTRLVAKPAVPLGDRTLVELVLAWLTRQGVTDTVINLHHLPATVTRVVGDGAHLGLSVRYSWEQPVLGSAGGPRRALPLLGADTFLIANGDTLCDFALGPMLAAHRASGAGVTMAVVPNPAPDRYNGLLLGDDDVVAGFTQAGSGVPSWHFVGVQIADASIFAGLADGVPAETVAGIYRAIVWTSPGRIRAWRVHTAFLDVGTPRDYLTAARLFGPSTGSQPAGVTDSIVWPGTTVEAGVRLNRCIVAGVAVPAGFEAENAIVVPTQVVRPGDRAVTRDGVAVFDLK